MSLFGSAPAASASSTNTQGDLSKDVAINQPPEDTVTDLVFSPAAEILAVSSWDKKVRVYEIDNSGQSQGKHAYDHEAPVFSVDFSKVNHICAALLLSSSLVIPILTWSL